MECAYPALMIPAVPLRTLSDTASVGEPVLSSYEFQAANETYNIRVAKTIEDRKLAWAFVHSIYSQKGYAKGDPENLWYGIHDALPATTTFIAERGGVIVATLTVVFDSAIKLPADALYAPELDALRSEGRRLCEIVSLVSAETRRLSALKLIRHMFKLAYLTTYYLENGTDFVITVNPNHAAFYRKGMLFEQVGGERSYEKVSGAPAVLLRLDLVAAQTVYKEQFDQISEERNLYRFFRDRMQDITHWLMRERTPMDEANFRKHFLSAPAIAAKTPPEHIEHVANLYYGFSFACVQEGSCP